MTALPDMPEPDVVSVIRDPDGTLRVENSGLSAGEVLILLSLAVHFWTTGMIGGEETAIGDDEDVTG